MKSGTSGNTTTASQPIVQTSVTPQVTTPVIAPPVDNNCVRPNQADNKIVFEGASYTICPKPELRASMNITSCLQPNPEFKVTLPTGKIISICPPPKQGKLKNYRLKINPRVVDYFCIKTKANIWKEILFFQDLLILKKAIISIIFNIR